MLGATAVAAQMTSRPVRDGSRPVRAGSGPVSEMSTNVRSGSGPVSGDGGSLRHSSPDRLGGHSVRGSAVTDVHSGPVSEASVGSVATKPLPYADFPPVEPDYLPEGELGGEAVVGWSPVWDLQPLAERVHGVRPLSREGLDAGDEEEEGDGHESAGDPASDDAEVEDGHDDVAAAQETEDPEDSESLGEEEGDVPHAEAADDPAGDSDEDEDEEEEDMPAGEDEKDEGH